MRCLPVRGSPGEDVALLRLAAPPLSSDVGGGGASIYFYRLLRAGSAAPASRGSGVVEGLVSAPQAGAPGDREPDKGTGNGFLGTLLRPPPPLVKLLVDGTVDLAAGRSADAERGLSDCMRLAKAKADVLSSMACLNNLALVHAMQGRFAQAHSELETVVTGLTPPIETPAELPFASGAQGGIADLLGRLGDVLNRLPPEQRQEYEAKLRAQQEDLQAKMRETRLVAWRKFAETDRRLGLERALLNIGNLELATGRLEEVEKHFVRAFKLHTSDEDPGCNAAAANDLAHVFRRLGRTAESAQYAALADRQAHKPGADGGATMLELGALHLAIAGAGSAGAPVVVLADSPTSAKGKRRATGGDAPLNYNEASNRFDDMALSRLLAEASRNDNGASTTRSVELWRRLAMRAAAARRPDMEFTAHAALMRWHAAQNEPATAIYHGKRAANVAQANRAMLNDRSPSREARRAFLRDRRGVYLQLAQLLLDEQRLAEAESVLQLLKEDEGQQFADDLAAQTFATLPLRAAEITLNTQDAETVGALRRLEEQRAAATSRMVVGAGALSMLGANQLGARRLKLALQIDELPEQLRREPLKIPTFDERARAITLDTRDFFVGSGHRAEAFVAHVVEDAPQFDPPPNPQELAKLADVQKRLPRILADITALMRNPPVDNGPAVSVKVRPGGTPKEKEPASVRAYYVAEPAEHIWRSVNEGDQLELRNIQRNNESSLRASRAAAVGSDDTTQLLRAQRVPTVLLYYLPGDNRLDALLVGPQARQHVRLAISRAQLNAEVDAFVALLRKPETDPLPAARALYQQLFAPLESAVAATGARVLALSLADRLRFVPFAALNDGQGWLVERYAIVQHPGGNLAGRLKPASPQWRAAAFGATRATSEFPALPSVRAEVAAVVRQSNGGAGVLPGEAWLDATFTAERLRAALAARPQVVHIASHFKFSPGDAAGSYLLLGDGGHLSLKELAGPQYRFDRTELVTLSACTTGLSADDTYGQEVDGLAALLMGQGASAVLASLWEVNDLSTATLMSTLYRLHESQHLSRALALQQAQLAMIRAASPPGTDAQRGVARVRLPGDPEPEPIDANSANLGQAHPFHWAAFVLMGNWL